MTVDLDRSTISDLDICVFKTKSSCVWFTSCCVEKDINSLHSFTVDKNYAFSKNRVVRCLDEIGNTTALVFNRNYCGKVDNNDVGRNLYKTELISMMDQLQGIGAVQNFKGTSDITVLPGNDVDSVVVDLLVQPVDSMEKLYMTVNVDA